MEEEKTNTELFEFMDEEGTVEYPEAYLEKTKGYPLLIKIEIERFKSIKKAEINLSSINILTGPNKSGKSTILEAISLAFLCLRKCTDTDHWQIKKRGGSYLDSWEPVPVFEPRELWYQKQWRRGSNQHLPINFTLHFENGIIIKFIIKFMFGFPYANTEILGEEIPPETLKQFLSRPPLYIPAGRKLKKIETYIADPVISQQISTADLTGITRNALYRLSVSAPELLVFLRDILRKDFDVDIEDVPFDPKKDTIIRAPYKEGDCELEILSGGSGLSQILTILTFICYAQPGILLIDEPDAHLHSSLQNKLFSFLCTLAEFLDVQIIATTHSRALLSQAPLENIIPVDLTREILDPLKSIDHLLLEYQRQGDITNVNLALLYQTKRCLFVEGSKDVDYMPILAESLGFGVFKGKNQFVIFEYSGVDKINNVLEIIKLFEKMIGTKPAYAILRDRDSNTPETISYIEEKYQGSVNLFIWDHYSIENYLLGPELLLEAIKKKKSDITINTEAIKEILYDIVEEIGTVVRGAFVTKTQATYRTLEIFDKPIHKGAADATDFLASIEKNKEEKLKYYPGKKIFGLFVGRIQKDFGINLRIEDIIKSLNKENAPEKLIEFFDFLNSAKS